MLTKYKYVIDKGTTSEASMVNEKRFSADLDVDDRAYKSTTKTLSGEPIVKIEINQTWLDFKAHRNVRCDSCDPFCSVAWELSYKS